MHISSLFYILFGLEMLKNVTFQVKIRKKWSFLAFLDNVLLKNV